MWHQRTYVCQNVDIFDNVPEVNTFCFYRKLKWGSIVIAIIFAIDGLFLFINPNPITKTLNGCNYDYPPKCELKDFLEFFIYFDAFRGLFNMAASVSLLIGIFMRRIMPVTIFLGTISIHIILGILLSLILVLTSYLGDYCLMNAHDSTYCFFVTVFGTSLNLYFLLVVKSYRTTLLEYVFTVNRKQYRFWKNNANQNIERNHKRRYRQFQTQRTIMLHETSRPDIINSTPNKIRGTLRPEQAIGNLGTVMPQSTNITQEISQPQETGLQETRTPPQNTILSQGSSEIYKASGSWYDRWHTSSASLETDESFETSASQDSTGSQDATVIAKMQPQ